MEFPPGTRQESTVASAAGRRNRSFDGAPPATANNGKWGASVARCSPNRWNPLLLPGGVQPRFSFVTSDRQAVSYAAIASASLSLALVFMSRHGGIHTDRQSRLYCTRRSYFAPISNRARPRLMVEAPGYCPPGPKCLFHATIYRHSRRTGMDEIAILRVKLKRGAGMAARMTLLTGETNPTKRLAF